MKNSYFGVHWLQVLLDQILCHLHCNFFYEHTWVAIGHGEKVKKFSWIYSTDSNITNYFVAANIVVTSIWVKFKKNKNVKTHTRTLALPKSQSLTRWVRGSTCRIYIKYIWVKQSCLFKKKKCWITYQKILRLHIPMANTRNSMDICQPPKDLRCILHLLPEF